MVQNRDASRLHRGPSPRGARLLADRLRPADASDGLGWAQRQQRRSSVQAHLSTRIEDYHGVNVTLDENGASTLGRGPQPARRVTAVEMKDNWSRACCSRGACAGATSRWPHAGERASWHQRAGAQLASRLACSPKHPNAWGVPRPTAGRPPFGWMLSQGPHDGTDATGGIARPDMHHVRHITGHAKVGHERTDGREGLKPPGRTEVRALVGVG